MCVHFHKYRLEYFVFYFYLNFVDPKKKNQYNEYMHSSSVRVHIAHMQRFVNAMFHCLRYCCCCCFSLSFQCLLSYIVEPPLLVADEMTPPFLQRYKSKKNRVKCLHLNWMEAVELMVKSTYKSKEKVKIDRIVL